MDFSFEHRFDTPLKDVAEAILDEAYQASLDGMEPLKKRDLLGQEEKGGRVVRRTRCVLGTDLGAAKRFLGNAEPAWIEESTWDEARQRWNWVIKPEVAKELLESQGTIDLVDEGDQTLRKVTGFVKIKVPLYGGKVENLIVRGLEEAYENEAGILREWLDR